MDSYGLIDKFLRNNLDDEDYAHFSCALDAVYAGQQDDALTAANDRIRELGEERDRWYGKATERAIELTAEREVSDKLEKALKRLTEAVYLSEYEAAIEPAKAALSEVAAIRAKQGGEG